MRARLKTGLIDERYYGDVIFWSSMRELEKRELNVELTATGNYECEGWYLSPEMLDLIDAPDLKDTRIKELESRVAQLEEQLRRMSQNILIGGK